MISSLFNMLPKNIYLQIIYIYIFPAITKCMIHRVIDTAM